MCTSDSNSLQTQQNGLAELEHSAVSPQVDDDNAKRKQCIYEGIQEKEKFRWRQAEYNANMTEYGKKRKVDKSSNCSSQRKSDSDKTKLQCLCEEI